MTRFLDELPASSYYDEQSSVLWNLAKQTDMTDDERAKVNAAFDRRRQRREEEVRKNGLGLPGVGFAACDSSD